jgi:FixJ family two-component response regulator
MIRSAPIISVIDDDLSVRSSIERVLSPAGLVVSTYASAQGFLERYDPNVHGCLVLDLAMPGMTGLELQNTLIAMGSTIPIIFLAGRARISESVQAMKNGAFEFLTKPVDDYVLVETVQNAVEKDRKNHTKRVELAEILKRLAMVSAREFEVLCHVVTGRLNKQIAFDLGITEKTVKVHRSRVMQRIGVSSVAALVRLDVQLGFASTRRYADKVIE